MTTELSVDAARRRLEEERTRLITLRDGIADETPDDAAHGDRTELAAVDQHPADAGSEVFEREKDLSIAQRLEAELDDVEAALGRLQDGTYGRCEICGKAIGNDRLEAIPHARYCVEDQAAAERRPA